MNNQEMNEKILNKKFKKSVFSGYDTVDVDSFFDQIIEYLQNNDKKVQSYIEENQNLNNQIKKLNGTIANLEKEKAKLAAQVKEYQEEGYDSIFLKRHAQERK